MFGMFPFMFNNNNLNTHNKNNNDIFNMLMNSQSLNSMFDQILSSDFLNDFVDEMLEEESYEISFKDYGEYYLIKGYLPGVSAKDVNIDFENNKAILTIKNKHVYSNGNSSIVAIIQNGTDYIKTFYVDEIDVTKLSASFDNDILILTLPKLKKVKTEEEQVIIDVENYKVE